MKLPNNNTKKIIKIEDIEEFELSDIEEDIDFSINRFNEIKEKYKNIYLQIIVRYTTEHDYEHDSYCIIKIDGLRYETDNEYYKRLEKQRKLSEAGKKSAENRKLKEKEKRYQNYLKLRKEFEK